MARRRSLGRKSARELDVWHPREETMRLLRWATELAVDDDDDERKRQPDFATLNGLQASPDLLQKQGLELIVALTDAVLEARVEAHTQQPRDSQHAAHVTYPDPAYPVLGWSE